MKIFHIYILLVSCVLFAQGCDTHSNINTGEKTVVADTLGEKLIETNKHMSARERADIERFVARKKWPMTETGTGLRYSVYETGSGPAVKSGDLVTVDFEISLLNGKVCYSSEDTGEEQFVVDHDHVESGLHEAIKYLRVGDKAMVIIPSHLAFGLTGDSDQIPPQSTVVYDLTVLHTQPKPVRNTKR